MPKSNDKRDRDGQQSMAFGVLWIAGITLVVLSGLAIYRGESPMTIFNSILPVMASWVGTILAYYFGRQNFEAGSEVAQRMGADQGTNDPVIYLMRPYYEIDSFVIPEGQSDKDVKLSDLFAKFNDKVNRLPVLEFDRKPKYMIHKSRVDTYITAEGGGGTLGDTLEQFITAQKAKGIEYGGGKGFLLAADQALVAEVKQKMDSTGCQDVFITKTGRASEPLIGWISNVRLGKSLEA